MNENHAQLCPSPEWAQFLHEDVLPWLAEQADLGESMIEVGPGPGASTEWLRSRVARLVAVEREAAAAATLAEKLAGTNVEVHVGDATNLEWPDNTFDSAGSFTMLHHLPSFDAQNRLLAEVLRVLRPGGVLIGSDSIGSDELHEFHHDDTYNPIDPGTLLTRLQIIGYTNITLRVDYNLRFVAHKPA